MAAGIVVAIVGAGCVVAGGRVSAKRVKGTWGSVTSETKHLSAGTGVVPRSASLLVLAGWVAVVTGIIIAIVAS